MSTGNHYFYDQNGKFRGTVSSIPPGYMMLMTQLLKLGCISYVLYWIWDKISHYKMLTEPYRSIGHYYHALIATPIQWGSWFFHKATSPGFTHYPNLNECIAILGIAIYIFSAYFMLRKIYDFSCFFGFTDRIWGTIFLGPAVFSALWFIGYAAFSWLFQH